MRSKFQQEADGTPELRRFKTVLFAKVWEGVGKPYKVVQKPGANGRGAVTTTQPEGPGGRGLGDLHSVDLSGQHYQDSSAGFQLRRDPEWGDQGCLTLTHSPPSCVLLQISPLPAQQEDRGQRGPLMSRTRFASRTERAVKCVGGSES